MAKSRKGTRRQPLQAFTKWLYKRRANIIFVAVVALIIFWLFGARFFMIARLMRQKQDLKAQLAEEKTRSVRLDETVDQIGKRHYIEYIAHKNLHLYYPDERIIMQVKHQPKQTKSK